MQPHAAVLERRQDVILHNLSERTVPVVSLPAPHILVCCQSHWPDNIFYFVKELRRPEFANPPIVILHPNEPTATQWGKVGIFHDVFFLKGSPIYELDLMRGGVLQAGISTVSISPSFVTTAELQDVVCVLELLTLTIILFNLFHRKNGSRMMHLDKQDVYFHSSAVEKRSFHLPNRS